MEGIEDPGRDAQTGFDNINRFGEELTRYLGEAKDRHKPIGIVYIVVPPKAKNDVPRAAQSINELIREGKTPDEVVRAENHFYLTFKIASEDRCQAMKTAIDTHLSKSGAMSRTGYILINPDDAAQPEQIIGKLEELTGKQFAA